MKTGDSFIDAQGRSWTVGQPLGQGTWGRSWIVSSGTGREMVLKVALGASDFPADVRISKDLLTACAAAANEQGKLLAGANVAYLPKLEAQLMVETRPALLIHRYTSNLGRRMDAGMPLSEVLRLMASVSTKLKAGRRAHGNLRPSNILLNERGEPVLADVATPATRDVIDRLEAIAPDRARYRPPEAHAEPRASWDTWALCQILYAASMCRGPIDDLSPQQARIGIPSEGIDKVEIAGIKDRAMARLSAEYANQRFRSRLTDKLGALLNRGLSPMAEPSPPYRFIDAAALLPRVEEITALLDPAVTEVGKILLGGATNQGVFQADDGISFATSVECSAGITEHDDIVCGLQLIDVDAEDGGRIPIHDASFKVSKHPSGRLRFQFTIPNVPPGRYRLKTAFSVKDSEHAPQIAQGELQVRPPPGYVPPAIQSAGGPITIGEIQGQTLDFPGSADADPPSSPSSAEEVWASDPGTALSDPGDVHSDPGGEVIVGFFPRPIAPPEEEESEAVVPEIAVAQQVMATAQQQPKAITPPLMMPMPAVMQAGGSFAPAGGSPSSPAMNAPPLPPALFSATSPGVQPLIPKISLGAPKPAAPPPPPTSAPSGLSWSALSAALGGTDDHFAIEADGLLPGAQSEGSDLPFWDESGFGAKARSIPGFDQILAMVRRDSYSAFVAAAALSFVLLLVMMALLKAF